MSARDHARFGLLHLRRGRWGDAQILRHRGSTSAGGRARSTRSTACCGGSTSGGPARGPRAARAAASSGSTRRRSRRRRALIDKPHIGGFLERLLAAVER